MHSLLLDCLFGSLNALPHSADSFLFYKSLVCLIRRINNLLSPDLLEIQKLHKRVVHFQLYQIISQGKKVWWTFTSAYKSLYLNILNVLKTYKRIHVHEILFKIDFVQKMLMQLEYKYDFSERFYIGLWFRKHAVLNRHFPTTTNPNA